MAKAKKKRVRDYDRERELAIRRGETGNGSDSGDARRHRARRKKEKELGRKLDSDEVVDHKTPIKDGGSDSSSNLRVRRLKSNASHGGKIGNNKEKGKKKK